VVKHVLSIHESLGSIHSDRKIEKERKERREGGGRKGKKEGRKEGLVLSKRMFFSIIPIHFSE
jgi:flagellar biosynthesis/type III secretory pathway protein FliH